MIPNFVLSPLNMFLDFKITIMAECLSAISQNRKIRISKKFQIRQQKRICFFTFSWSPCKPPLPPQQRPPLQLCRPPAQLWCLGTTISEGSSTSVFESSSNGLMRSSIGTRRRWRSRCWKRWSSWRWRHRWSWWWCACWRGWRDCDDSGEDAGGRTDDGGIGGECDDYPGEDGTGADDVVDDDGGVVEGGVGDGTDAGGGGKCWRSSVVIVGRDWKA